MLKKNMILPVVICLFWSAGCSQHHIKVDPVETRHEITVKPMEMTINVNVNVRVDRALDDFFGDIDAVRKTDTLETPSDGKSK